MQQYLAGAFHRKPAVFFDFAILHFEQAGAFDDQRGVFEVTLNEGLAIENDALTVECFSAYCLHS
jgi:hypothetical protein